MADDDRFYVKTLTLENFRCFEKTELGPFDPHFNLIIGENGAGKSSVLVALASLMSAVASFGRWDATILFGRSDTLLAPSDVRIERGEAKPSQERPPVIAAVTDWDGTELVARLALRPPFWVEEYQNPFAFKASNVHVYPVVVWFNTSRRFDQPSAEPVDFDRAAPVRGDAFKDWRSAGLSADELRAWFKDATLASLQSDPAAYDPTLRLAASACVAAIEDAVGVRYLQARRDIVIDFRDGRSLAFGSMSDGQRALIGLISEIVRRACILNFGLLGERTLTETPGLVLIDEIDLHLHPKWQREIVRALRGIFPKIQFFATTHSPQVIGEAKPEQIVLLSKDGKQKRPSNSYGMDSSWILECVMEADGRTPEIAQRLNFVFELIDEDRFEEAKSEIENLRAVIGADPKLVAAESYMWNLGHVSDEAAE